MSSANKTENLQLNQWVGTDPFCMADFNADNQKIDAAIATKANIAFGNYTGNGRFGQDNPTVLTFDFEPKLVIIRTRSFSSKNNNVYGVVLVKGTDCQYNDTFGSGNSACYPTWSNNSVSWYTEMGHAGDQCNNSATQYHYVAIG